MKVGAGETEVQGDMLLPANDRVEGRDAALSRRVPSHDGLAGTVPPGLTLKGHAMFDEHPDGDPHGECAAEIHRLQSLNDEALDLLATMFDAYEDGPDCYEDPEDCAGHLGKAVNLDDAVFDRIADILNEHRPRNSVVTANVKLRGEEQAQLATSPSRMEGSTT